MNSRNMIRIATLAASALAFAAANAEIYTWVDEDGVVHYADQPQHQDAQQSAIESDRTDDAGVERRLAETVALNEAQRERFRERREGPDPDDLVEQAKRTVELRRQSCEAAREKLKQFTGARRLYTLDENGAKVYLDEEKTMAARQEVNDKVREYCD